MVKCHGYDLRHPCRNQQEETRDECKKQHQTEGQHRRTHYPGGEGDL